MKAWKFFGAESTSNFQQLLIMHLTTGRKECFDSTEI